MESTANFYSTNLSIKPGYSTVFSRWEGSRSKCFSGTVNSFNNLSDNDSKGLISKKAATKIRMRVEWLLLLAKTKRNVSDKCKVAYDWKVNFITLTLSSKQIHSDNVIKRELLNHFITVAKRKWNMNVYVWRAEAQRNGNIHFHIMSDVFIPWKELRDEWNIIQNKLGYVARFARHVTPNSTDVHSLRNIKNIAAYIAKYTTKNQKKRRSITGKLWGCSDNLKSLEGVQIQLSGSQSEALRTSIQNKSLRSKLCERATVLYAGVKEMVYKFDWCFDAVKEYIRERFRDYYIFVKNKKEKLCKTLLSACLTVPLPSGRASSCQLALGL